MRLSELTYPGIADFFRFYLLEESRFTLKYEKQHRSGAVTCCWSRRRESDPRIYLGKVVFYH